MKKLSLSMVLSWRVLTDLALTIGVKDASSYVKSFAYDCTRGEETRGDSRVLMVSKTSNFY